MENKDKPILNLIQQIKDGTVEPSVLTKDERQQCVEVLVLEGYAPSQIAQLVNRSEKTIKRDIAEIRSRNSLTPSMELMKQLVGDLIMKSEAHQTRLTRLARTNEGSVSERSQAEYMAWRVVKERTEALQSLGYLPMQPQKVVGDIFHHLSIGEEEKTLAQIEKDILEIEKVAEEAGSLDQALEKKLVHYRHKLSEAKLNHEVKALRDQQNQSKTEENNHAE